MISIFFEAREFYFGANFDVSFFVGCNDFLFKGKSILYKKKETSKFAPK